MPECLLRGCLSLSLTHTLSLTLSLTHSLSHTLSLSLSHTLSPQVAFPELAKDTEVTYQPSYGCRHGGEDQDLGTIATYCMATH